MHKIPSLLFQVLIDQGADVNAHNIGKWTALMFGAERGHLPIVQVIIGQINDTITIFTSSNLVSERKPVVY